MIKLIIIDFLNKEKHSLNFFFILSTRGRHSGLKPCIFDLAQVLRRMRFLMQPSYFILAWDRHWELPPVDGLAPCPRIEPGLRRWECGILSRYTPTSHTHIKSDTEDNSCRLVLLNLTKTRDVRGHVEPRTSDCNATYKSSQTLLVCQTNKYWHPSVSSRNSGMPTPAPGLQWNKMADVMVLDLSRPHTDSEGTRTSRLSPTNTVFNSKMKYFSLENPPHPHVL